MVKVEIRPTGILTARSVVWLWAFILSAGAVLPLAAGAPFTNQVPGYISREWLPEDGLPHAPIQAVTQIGDGYFWLGTKEGLVRFDGVRFAAGDAVFPEMENRSFTAFCGAHDGTLWMGGEDGQLRGIKDGNAREWDIPGLGGGGLVTKLFESSDGSLWIGTETNGLIRFKNGTFTRFTTGDGLGHDSIRSLCEDADGGVWIATAHGASRWKDGIFTTLKVRDGLLHNSIRHVHFDRQGNLWIASHLGLSRLKDGAMTHYRKAQGLADNLVSAIFEDRHGALWIGTFNGLNRMVAGELFTESREDGTSYDRVHSILEDRDGNLWVGNRDGLSRLKPRAVMAHTQQHGLTHNDATSLMEDRDGNLWITFWGGGVNKIENGTVRAYTRQQGLSSELVLTMHQSRSGDLWFGMDYDGGLNLLKDGKFTHFREDEGFKDHAVRVIHEDSRGTLWIGTRTALVSFRDGEFHRYTTRDGLPSDTIETIHEDRHGALWFGTAGGLAARRGDGFVSFTTGDGLSHNGVTSIHEDEDGILWLGTRGGLTRLHDGKFTAYSRGDGLFRDEIRAVLEDDLGFLWMSSPQGIFCVARDDLNSFAPGTGGTVACVSFGKTDGMASIECKGPGGAAAWKGRDGRLWFPTSKGVVSIDPRVVRINSNAPPVRIEELRVDGKSADIFSEVKLVADNQELLFRYTAFSFSAPEKIRFKYKLEGLDAGWVEAGDLREARYSHLPAGSYRFHVIAANGDGVWNQEGGSVALVLAPPYWQTWWFGCLLALGFVGTVAGGVRYISVQKLQRQLASLEQQHAVEKERSRIAKDMHDDLGANLTQICILSELARREACQPRRVMIHADAISDTARELVQSMDEIVWAANPRNDNLRKLSAYMFQYAENFLAPTRIRGRFDHPVSVPEHPLSAEVRHNLFLMVKEALNNAVKHSMAGEVWLRLTLRNRFLEIRIEDNGRGFSLDADRSFGNGLANMKKRIEEIGGCFQAESAPGAGTLIAARMKLLSDPPDPPPK